MFTGNFTLEPRPPVTKPIGQRMELLVLWAAYRLSPTPAIVPVRLNLGVSLTGLQPLIRSAMLLNASVLKTPYAQRPKSFLFSAEDDVVGVNYRH